MAVSFEQTYMNRLLHSLLPIGDEWNCIAKPAHV